MADGNLVSAKIVIAGDRHDACGDCIDRGALGAAVVDAVMHRVAACNRMDTGTVGASDVQAVERIAEAFKDKRFTLFGIVGVKGTLRVRVFVAERFVVADGMAVEFGIENLAANPDGILIEFFFEQDAELVARARELERDLALQNGTHDAYHASRNTHLV